MKLMTIFKLIFVWILSFFSLKKQKNLEKSSTEIQSELIQCRGCFKILPKTDYPCRKDTRTGIRRKCRNCYNTADWTAKKLKRDTKECSRCHQVFPLTNFYFRLDRGTPHARCKQCYNDLNNKRKKSERAEKKLHDKANNPQGEFPLTNSLGEILVEDLLQEQKLNRIVEKDLKNKFFSKKV